MATSPPPPPSPTSPTSLRCEIVSDDAVWASRRNQIDGLLATCALANPHTSSAWLEAWWRAFGSKHALHIGMFWRGAQLVGYAPLMVTRGRFLGVPHRALRFIGDGISDYADVFSRDDDPAVKAEMVRTIVDDWAWDDLSLCNVRGESSTIVAFEAHDAVDAGRCLRRVCRDEQCPYIDLRGMTFENYYKSLSRNHRRELQKRRHKLAALGDWRLDFEPAVPAAALFDEFQRLHRERSQEMAWASVFDLPGFRGMFTTLLDTRTPSLSVLCSTLRHGDALMSYTLGFVANNIYYHWNIAFDRAYEAIAPNKVHHQFLIEECFRRGYSEFDFMRGGYEYKFKWTDSARDNYRVRLVRRRGWRSPINRLMWLQEREAGSTPDRVIAKIRELVSTSTE